MNTPLCVLAIIDGFGYSPQVEGNAIAAANTPNLDYLWSHYPHFLLKAAEEEVGLAFGEMGNSEVGHITIGTGRVIPQNLSVINKAIEDGSFFDNPAFLKSINHVKTNQSQLHLLGIVSTAGVHGHLLHFLSLIKLASSHGLKNLNLHLILDGRDSGPRDAAFFLREINAAIQKHSLGNIVSICGRAFTMDRNNNWERTQLSYQLLSGQSQYAFTSAEEALEYYYAQGLDDENIPPTHIIQGKLPPVKLNQGDSIIFTNFREDRARQITKALSLPAFTDFPRHNHPDDLQVTTMTSYEKALPVDVAYPPPPIHNTLSDIFSQNQVTQIHIAETEKYAHVTYFFNGGRETKRPGEEFFLIPSLKPEEFESHPEMSAKFVAQAVIDSIKLGYKFIVFNFANSDMVGHTGNFESSIKAVECVDSLFKDIWASISTQNGFLMITADHGNSEIMINPKSKAISKEHTISPVPFIVAHPSLLDQNAKASKIMSEASISGILSDIAPTILNLSQLPIPSEMSGTPLVNL